MGLLSLAPAAAQQDALKPRLDRLCAQLEEQRRELHIPGMAIAIVKDDKVVLARGFGLRDIERRKPVTEDTLFAIGSSSKAFTATLIGMLVDDGKMSWDDKVSRHLPYFKLKEETANEEATIRDLLCHRTGLTRMGMLWAGNNVDRERIIRQAAQAEPLNAFREKFNYNNVMFLAAGVASARASGAESWDALLKERILDPLNMRRSHTDAAKFPDDPNASEGYYWDEDRNDYINPPMRVLHAIGPAGAINSNVRDMAQWLRFQLGGGEYEGKRLITLASLVETRTPQIAMAPNVNYGLGWMLQDWKGHRDVHHGGSIDGFGAMVALMPDDNIGFVLLTNVTVTPLQDIARELVWQAMLGETVEGDEVARTTKPGKPMSAAELEPYLGRYRLEALGVDATVQIKDDKLAVDIPGQMVFTLKWPDERGRWVFDFTADIEVAFIAPVDGEVPSMTLYQKVKLNLPKTDANKATVDVAKLPRAGTEWSARQLAPLVGTYRFAAENVDFVVSIDGGRLRFEKPGSPPRALEWPGESGLWAFDGQSNRSFRFNLDETGSVNSADLHIRVRRHMPRIKAASDIDITIGELLKRRGYERNACSTDVKLRITRTVNYVNQGVRGKVTEIIDGPNRFMMRIDLSPFGYIKTVVDGDSGWVESDIDFNRAVIGKELELLQLGHPCRIFGEWPTAFKKVEIVKKEELDGETVYVVRCMPKSAPRIVRYVSAKTGLVLKEESFVIAKGLGSIPLTVRHSEYRDVHGIQMPARSVSEMRFAGEVIFRLEGVETDFEIPANAFKRPRHLK